MYKRSVVAIDKPIGLEDTIYTCESIFMPYVCTIYHQNINDLQLYVIHRKNLYEAYFLLLAGDLYSPVKANTFICFDYVTFSLYQ